jgi:hypothetical protein
MMVMMMVVQTVPPYSMVAPRSVAVAYFLDLAKSS